MYPKQRSSLFQILMIAIFGKEIGERLPASSFKKRILYHFQNELNHSGVSRIRFVADKFRVKLSNLICEDRKGVNI